MRLVTCLAVALALAMGACTDADSVDVAAAASGTAPPADASLDEVDWPTAAQWMVEEVARSGRPVVVKFFASWCGPCRAEAPVLLDAVAAHPDVAVVAVAHEDRLAQAAAWMEEYGFDALPTLFDPLGDVARAMGARGMPAVSFVDSDLKVVHTHTGPIDPALLEAWMAFLIGAGPRPSARPDDPATDRPTP